jgi:hypothetical protein
VDDLSSLSIDADESIWLEREFEEKKVWDVVRDLNGDKAHVLFVVVPYSSVSG